MGKKVKWSLPAALLLLISLLAGCKAAEVPQIVPLQEVWTVYQTEDEVSAYTLDEAGNLYTLEYKQDIPDSPSFQLPEGFKTEDLAKLTPEELAALLEQKEEDRFFLRKYTADGALEYSRTLKSELCSYVTAMAVKDGTVYFVPYLSEGEEAYATLYAYRPDTEELMMLKQLPYLASVQRIVPMEDCIYLLGTNQTGHTATDSRKYEYTGEKLFCYTVSEDRLEELGLEEPMDICAAGEQTLCIYAHMEGAFCFLSYDTECDAMKVMAKTEEYKLGAMAFCAEEQAVIYCTGAGRGLVLSTFPELAVETELYPEGYFGDKNLCYADGTVACRISSETLLTFPLAKVNCENKVLRYITTETDVMAPFGCGYEMQRNTLTRDKFALKVMALDRDFDVCFVNSGEPFAYNLKEYGVFYPLNDLQGIQEYLDSCFPYVREAATDKDGNIWMLPVTVDITGILVKGEAVDDVLFQKNMTYVEYCQAYAALPEAEKKKTESPASFANPFIGQYILDRRTIDTEEFRNVLQEMAKSTTAQTEAAEQQYRRIYYENDYRALFAQKYGEDAVIYAEPKLAAEDKNAGSCLFLAVNPYSDNLEAALSYLSSLIAYLQNKEDAPLFFENRVVEDTPYERSLYELYQNGTILFSIDTDVYDGYQEVLEGTVDIEEYVSETETKVNIFLYE